MLCDSIYTDYPENVRDCDQRDYNPNKPRVKDIIWNHYDWFLKMDELGKARPTVLENIQKTLLCNTCYLGYDVFKCPNCGNENLLFHKCHSRFCNKCGVKLQKTLAAKAEVMCIDVPHRHIVFTIPDYYRNYFRKDRSALNLLFVASRNTICKMMNEKTYRKEKRIQEKGLKKKKTKDNYYMYRNYTNVESFGMIATLHTFGRDLKWNPHIHALVPKLSYNEKKNTYKRVTHFDYANLRKTWQYEVNRLFKEYFGDEVKAIVNDSYKRQDNGFYVYAKANKYDLSRDSKVSDNVKGCVNYMMRYAARPAMAESRITSYDKKTDDVVWFYDDHKTEERIVVKEKGINLLKKMIIHIPDKNFRLVRYYGFYNNKCQDMLEKIHVLLGKESKRVKTKHVREKMLVAKLNKLKFRTMCIDSYNKDVLRCVCGCEMRYVDSYDPLDGITNDRKYREDCINEMRKLWLHRRRARGRPSYS